MMKIRQIFWDWNGTLLDDLWYAIGVRNRTFPLFGLPVIENLEEYFSQFTFPVREYYYRAGVTEENFNEVAHAWMNEYVRGQESIPLHSDALETIASLRKGGLSQVVLSASQIEILKGQLALYGLENTFDDVLGHDNIYADSKEMIGVRYMQKTGLTPEECMMIGDTLHDADVARGMGIRCILVARGHQSRETLETAGVPVLGSLLEAAELILKTE
ncbi:MAG: HAD family hydrolase [Clostridiales bacterium]|nr:HAD family hydrolase [Clostridiales bacterium]